GLQDVSKERDTQQTSNMNLVKNIYTVFFSSRRRHTRSKRDWSSDVCSSDLQNRRSKGKNGPAPQGGGQHKQQSQQDAELGRGDGGAGGWGHKFVAAQLLHDESRHTHTNAGA